MSDYGSDDGLLDDIDADQLLLAGSKRVGSSQDEPVQPLNKRVRLEAETSKSDQYDSIAQSILKRNFGYDSFRHEQVRPMPFLHIAHSRC
jgi:hypothetical protein